MYVQRNPVLSYHDARRCSYVLPLRFEYAIVVSYYVLLWPGLQEGSTTPTKANDSSSAQIEPQAGTEGDTMQQYRMTLARTATVADVAEKTHLWRCWHHSLAVSTDAAADFMQLQLQVDLK